MIINIKEHDGSGTFPWEFSHAVHADMWQNRCYDPARYWGKFDRGHETEAAVIPDYAIARFIKHGPPVLSPTPGQWDCGRFGGGVHNGSILVKDGIFYYIYRGEMPLPPEKRAISSIDYICDIGVATSADGIHFEKRYDVSPFFRHGADEKYSYEDVNVVEHDGRYYMFVNRWDWGDLQNPKGGGVYIAVSDDLLHWEKVGLAFPNADRIHRNACVLQNPHNQAVRVNGKFVMYLNYGLIAFSDDLIHWESEETDQTWPGGENCFALADYDAANPDRILVFTGGHHTGFYYAIGEVLLDKSNVKQPLSWLMRPALYPETHIPHEDGYSYTVPPRPVSDWRNTIFFTGMTLHRGKWWIYYGGSEYYTCLAHSFDHAQEVKTE